MSLVLTRTALHRQQVSVSRGVGRQGGQGLWLAGILVSPGGSFP